MAQRLKYSHLTVSLRDWNPFDAWTGAKKPAPTEVVVGDIFHAPVDALYPYNALEVPEVVVNPSVIGLEIPWWPVDPMY